MKKFSHDLLIAAVREGRKAKGWNQTKLSAKTGINRSILSRLEQGTYSPSLDQLDSLAEALEFDVSSLYIDTDKHAEEKAPHYNIAVTGSGNLKLSLAALLSKQHHVTVIDGNPGNVEMINQHISPVQDEYIAKLLGEKDLDLTASTDAENVRKNADYVVITIPNM